MYLYSYFYVYLYFTSECSSVNHILYMPIYRCRSINLLKVLKQHQYFSANDHPSNATINLTIRVLPNFPGCKARIFNVCPFSHWRKSFPLKTKLTEGGGGSEMCCSAWRRQRRWFLKPKQKVLILFSIFSQYTYMLVCKKLSILLVLLNQ